MKKPARASLLAIASIFLLCSSMNVLPSSIAPVKPGMIYDTDVASGDQQHSA